MTPLGAPPNTSPMLNGPIPTTAWATWFSQVWTYAKGSFSNEATASKTMEVNTTYVANDTGLVTLTLPARFNVGDRFVVVGYGAGLWEIAQNDGQTIHSSTGSTTTGVTGSVAATNRYDAVTLVGTVRDTDLTVISSAGTLVFA